jgi:uncharacterized protein with HEPN domain
MLDAARKAVGFAAGRQRQDLDTYELLSLALVRLIEVIGEAARSVSEQLRTQHPEVPWKAIIGTRDRLIHGYFDVDLDIVWEIVSADLPDLIPRLEVIRSALRQGTEADNS